MTKYIVIFLSVVIIGTIGILIYNSMIEYPIAYNDLPNGIEVVEQDGELNFKVDLCIPYQYVGTREDMYVDYDKDIIYYRGYFTISASPWNMYFHKSSRYISDSYKADGSLIGESGFVMRTDPKGNHHECTYKLRELYYRNPDGSVVLVWKAKTE